VDAPPKLSVVMPVYNERLTLSEILERVQAVAIPKEIIVIDDGSTDGTRELLRRLEVELAEARRAGTFDEKNELRILFQDRNQGKGAAVRRGFAEARGDVVLIQDADLEYDPEDWPLLIAPVLKGRAKVVYGSRITGERRNMLYLHWVGNKMLSLATNLLYNTTLSDMETCYKLFDREVLRGITIKSDRFDFEPEITAKVLRQGIRIYEVPISYAGREFEEGKKITWRDGFAALYALFKYRVVK
jgi:glycosyltransferase involved in cell wall biosynthesis